MNFIADFHIHSHFSIATSKNLIPEYLELWAKIKGINVIGTGDCIHPGWVEELKEKFEPAGNGLYKLKKEFILDESKNLTKHNIPKDVYFMLTGELSSIYKKNDRVRKVHNLCVFPDFEALEKVQGQLDKMGNIRSDGRPILGIDSKIILEMVLESSDYSFLIPAHIWTPWFSVLGSKSGFDTVEECYGDLTKYIFAVETGLSSDPPMNWACSFLDPFKLVSNSDAHSPEKLGREANLFNTDLSYRGIYDSLKGEEGFLGTIEFFPQEGKYHFDGHRKCQVKWDPLETLLNNGICTVCGKPVTKGVMYRVAELADRSEKTDFPNKRNFDSITQLPDLLAQILGYKNSKSKGVMKEYHRLIGTLGSEFHILLNADICEIKEVAGELIAEGIRRLRDNEVHIEDGYDGEFGTVRAFTEGELSEFSGNNLFNLSDNSNNKKNVEKKRNVSIDFDVEEFQLLKKHPLEKREKGLKSSKKINIADEQKIAIEHKEGPCMIVAGPGSGKTRILTERICHLVDKDNIKAENILAITFSNKAAQEISERLHDRINVEDITISTFHAFGLSIIKEYLHLTGRNEKFFIIDHDDKLRIIKEISDSKTKANAIAKDIEFIKQGHENEKMDLIFEKYNTFLQRFNAFDLSDLVYLPVKILEENPEILRKYQDIFQWILVDEFQDINAIQYKLIKLLAKSENPNLFVIGDPDQSIYAFRGSSSDFINKLQDDYRDIKKVQLSSSYRCPDIIMKAGEQLLLKENGISGNSVDIKIKINQMNSDKSEADWIAAKIEEMMGGVRSFSMDSGITDGHSNEESVSFSDFGVLCRSAFMFDAIIEAFNNHGISYQLLKNNSFYQFEPFISVIKIFRNVYYNNLFLLDEDNYQYKNKIDEMIANNIEISQILDFLMKENKLSKDNILKMKSFSNQFNNDYSEFFNKVATGHGIDDYDYNAEAVSLLTLHSSKGLEFDTVFIPGCEQGIIPFELFGPNDKVQSKEEERLFYVGVTRTQRNLFLSYSDKRNYKGRVLNQEKSSFLDRFEKKLYEFDERKPTKRKNNDVQLDLF